MVPRASSLALVILCVSAAGVLGAPRDQVRQDWLTQNAVRWNGPGGSVATTVEDARGAVDGVIDGSWGFHTGLQESPWWQVDL